MDVIIYHNHEKGEMNNHVYLNQGSWFELCNLLLALKIVEFRLSVFKEVLVQLA